jgi:non-heme chloroperoxidase
MRNCIGCAVVTLLSALTITHAWAQEPASWKDPSPHRTQLVRVDEDVRLEVLDWGGPGRAVGLLAGAGNTAHVFDDFAPKLSRRWHVYGITRRGYGASSRPASGYGDQRLADDIVQVLDSLKIPAPVLVGHSMAGGEMTTIARQHPDRVTGLVYLDALGDPRDWPASDPKYMELAKKLPPPRTAPSPIAAAESKSFSGYRDWQMRNQRFAFPESELRNSYETNPDGTKGNRNTTATIFQAIGDGQIKRDYSGIRVPVLAFYEFPRSREDEAKDGEDRAALDAFNSATAIYIGRWNNNLLSHVGDVHFIDLPGAGHYVFLTRETEVLTGLNAFLAGLP